MPHITTSRAGGRRRTTREKLTSWTSLPLWIKFQLGENSSAAAAAAVRIHFGPLEPRVASDSELVHPSAKQRCI